MVPAVGNLYDIRVQSVVMSPVLCAGAAPRHLFPLLAGSHCSADGMNVSEVPLPFLLSWVMPEDGTSFLSGLK